MSLDIIGEAQYAIEGIDPLTGDTRYISADRYITRQAAERDIHLPYERVVSRVVIPVSGWRV